MKYLVCYVLGAGLLLSHAAHAQFGLRAGANLSRLSHSNENSINVNSEARLGYEGGIYYELSLGQRISLVPELDFLRQSQHLRLSNYQLNGSYFGGDYRLTRSQLSLPVLVRATLGKLFYLEAGPQLTYLVGGRQTGTETISGFGFTYPLVLDRATAERFRRLDVGACVGVGLKLPAGVGVILRAYQGLRSTSIPLDTFTAFPSTYAQPVYQQSLQASLTYQLSGRQ